MDKYIDFNGFKKLCERIVSKTAKKASFDEHVGNKSNPHGVTKSQVGLGNVPNVSTNDQTPTYTAVENLAKLVTGEKLGVAFGKIAKAVDELITHLSDTVKHVSVEERTSWNGKAAGDHTHSKATSSADGFMSAADKTKLDGIATGANKYTHPTTVGNKHIPAGGSSGQILRWSADGTAEWGADNNTTYTPASEAPKAAGTAAVGSSAKYAREDHVHPLQTSVSGNAGTATKLKTSRTINGVSFDGYTNITHYGICSTAAATAAKVVALTGFVLDTGAEVTVKFTVTNTAANPTLNVNNTGAKPIYYRNAAITAGYLAANRTYTFKYNGTQYELAGDINTDTHWTSKLIVGESNTAKANAEATNGNVWINLLDNSTIRQAHNIVGTGATTVISDANGKITVNSTDTIYTAATSLKDGLMSKTDKAKLDGLASDGIDIVTGGNDSILSSNIGLPFTISGKISYKYCFLSIDIELATPFDSFDRQIVLTRGGASQTLYNAKSGSNTVKIIASFTSDGTLTVKKQTVSSSGGEVMSVDNIDSNNGTSTNVSLISLDSVKKHTAIFYNT